MTRLEISRRVRSLTRDFSESIFRSQDIIDFINEGIDRFIQLIPELQGLSHLRNNNDAPLLIPNAYRHLLSIYSASRCFSQDERYYQATTLMNEFETKLDELKSKIESGSIIITNPQTGEPIQVYYDSEYVITNNYFRNSSGFVSSDESVEGVN